MIAWLILKQGFANLLTAGRDLRTRRRLKREQARIRRRIKQHFARMGESVHRNRGELERDQTLPQLSQEVTQLETRLIELDQAIERVGSGRTWAPPTERPVYAYPEAGPSRTCPHCTATIPTTTIFCPDCGQKTD